MFAGSSAQYLPTGHLAYALDNNLFAIAFDPDRLEKIGDSVPMDGGVYQMPWVSLTQAAISDTGTLVYVPGTTLESPLSKCDLIGVDRQGKIEKISAPPEAYSQFKISPDGTKVAVTAYSGEVVQLFRSKLSTHSGDVVQHSGISEKVDNFTMESVVNFDRNVWSTSNGMDGR
jgi:hypothetical protein